MTDVSYGSNGTTTPAPSQPQRMRTVSLTLSRSSCDMFRYVSVRLAMLRLLDNERTSNLSESAASDYKPFIFSHVGRTVEVQMGDGHLQNGSPQATTHCHANGYTNRSDRDARKVLTISIGLCLTFMTAEMIGGYLANSLAIITDAAHLLTDFASFLISLFSLYLSNRPATRRMSFGWHRAEVIGALVSMLLIWVITGVLLYMAVERLINKTYNLDPTIMLIVASIGVCVNITMGCVLHYYGSHSHGSDGQKKRRRVSSVHSSAGSGRGSTDRIRSEENTPLRATKQPNINVKAAFLHILGDFIQSVGVLTAAFIMCYRPDWQFIDPICTIMFAIIVLFTTINVLRDVLNVLMEGSPRQISFTEVLDHLKELDGVEKVHDLHIWSLTLDKVAISVHLAADENEDFQALLNRAIELLRQRFGVYECTIQIERYSDDMDNCGQCKPLKN